MAKTPKAREWRKRNEGLKPLCTTKGAKEGKRQVRFAVAIAHSAGTVICQRVERGMNGSAYALFIDTRFDTAIARTVKPRSRRVLQDNCPVQNSAAARRALQKINVSSFQIPARSPDLNPIENLFNQIRADLQRQAVLCKIVKETEDEFACRVEDTFRNWPVQRIDNLVESMPRRIAMIIKSNGQRLKY